MAEKRIGVAVTAPDSNTALAAIEDLEKRGFPAAWMTSGSASGGDSVSVFAAPVSNNPVNRVIRHQDGHPRLHFRWKT